MKGKQVVNVLRQAGVKIIADRGKGGKYLLRYGTKQAILLHKDFKAVPEHLLKRICTELGIKYQEVVRNNEDGLPVQMSFKW